MRAKWLIEMCRNCGIVGACLFTLSLSHALFYSFNNCQFQSTRLELPPSNRSRSRARKAINAKSELYLFVCCLANIYAISKTTPKSSLNAQSCGCNSINEHTIIRDRERERDIPPLHPNTNVNPNSLSPLPLSLTALSQHPTV